MRERNDVNLLNSFPLPRNLLGGIGPDEDRNYLNSDQGPGRIYGTEDDLVYRRGEVFPESDLVLRPSDPPMRNVPLATDQPPLGPSSKESPAPSGTAPPNGLRSHSTVADTIVRPMPTSEEIGARNMAALKTPATPGYDGENNQSVMPDRSFMGLAREGVARARDEIQDIAKQFDGRGRREEEVQELPPGVRVGDNDTSAWSKMALGRGNDAAVADIAQAQLPGATVRRDVSGNVIVKLPDNAVKSQMEVTGMTLDGAPEFEFKDTPVGGQEYYLNRPGFSRRDVANGAVDWAPKVVGELAGDAATLATDNPIIRRAVRGVAAVEASVMLDQLAQQAGSNPPMDIVGAAETGQKSLLYPSRKDVLGMVSRMRQRK